LALRWRDVDWTGSALTIRRSLSSGVEWTTKTGHVRRVPMADQLRPHSTGSHSARISSPPTTTSSAMPSAGRSTARRSAARYKRARDAAGLRPLRWHDLRHIFGSLLVAGGVDIVSVKDDMGHSQLTTTSRYLHARPATERAAAFTGAFGGSADTARIPVAKTVSRSRPSRSETRADMRDVRSTLLAQSNHHDFRSRDCPRQEHPIGR
jgi:integrase